MDRAVGPFSVPPATWAVIGVDGNGDGNRDPQSIDDAALATGVLLCSTGFALDTPAGREDALSEVAASPEFIEAVLAIDDAYRAEDRPTRGAPTVELSAPEQDSSPTDPAPTVEASLRALEFRIHEDHDLLEWHSEPPPTPTATPSATLTPMPSHSPTSGPTTAPTKDGCPDEPTGGVVDSSEVPSGTPILATRSTVDPSSGASREPAEEPSPCPPSGDPAATRTPPFTGR